MLLALLLACRVASAVDACESDVATCLACASSDECGYTGNPCTSTVFCAQEDAGIAVVSIGCESMVEYSWPADDTCVCLADVCRPEE